MLRIALIIHPEYHVFMNLCAEQAGVNFIYEWLLASVFPALIRLILQGALDVSAEKDKQYFIEKMEKLLGCKFSEASFEFCCPIDACVSGAWD